MSPLNIFVFFFINYPNNALPHHTLPHKYINSDLHSHRHPSDNHVFFPYSQTILILVQIVWLTRIPVGNRKWFSS